MAIDFPDSPSNGDIHTVSGKRWEWDGEKWTAYGASLAPDVLKVDVANNRVGINDTTPSYSLDVTGTAHVTGAITASGGVAGALTGNADTATALATARAINGVDFDGSGAITVTAAAGTLSGSTLASGVTASSLTSVGALTALTVTGDLTVNGTTTTINSTTLTVDDKNIELGSVASPSDTTADGGGITLKGASDKTILWTNSTDAWHFNQGINVTSGNVGIGTTAPPAKLSVDTSTTRGGYTNLALGAGGNNPQMEFYNANTSWAFSHYDNDRLTICSNVSGSFVEARGITIKDSNGYVGIGTTTPTAKLSVTSGNTSFSALFGKHDDEGLFLHSDASSSHYNWRITTQTVVDMGFEIAASASVGGTDWATPAFVIKQNGNVGIGDTSPTQKLDVAGNIAANSTGTYPVVIGVGYTAGAANIGVGSQTLTAVTSGDNVAIGYYALRNCTTAGWQVAIGNYALGSMTTQSGAPNYAQYSVAVGHEALWGNVNGAGGNVAVGFRAGKGATTGMQNTFIGMQSNQGASTGSNNTCLGYNSATTGSTTSNEVTLGNSSVSNLRCQDTTISQVSDERDKTNIQDLDMGLEFICRLQPRRFEWNMRDGGKVGVEETGFVAQELQQAMVDEGKVIPGLVHDDNPDRLEAAPMALFTTLVKAVQELADKVEALT
jgi:hypothetical protein